MFIGNRDDEEERWVFHKRGDTGKKAMDIGYSYLISDGKMVYLPKPLLKKKSQSSHSSPPY